MRVLVLMPRCRTLLLALIVLASTTTRVVTQTSQLRSDTFAEVNDGERHRQILYIGPGSAPGSMLVLTRYSLQEFDAEGRQLRRARFPNELWLPFGARFSPNAQLEIIGLKSGFFRSWIDVLDLSGQRLRRMRGWQYAFLELADVMGDAAKEVLVRYENGVAILNGHGVQLAFLPSPRYLYQMRTIAVPDTPKRAIAMWMWRDAKRGTDIGVYRADGGVIGEWNENPSDRISVFALHDGVEGLWSAFDGHFVERTPTGVVRRRFAVPGMGHYRYVHGGALAGGRVVLIGSPPGSTAGAAICVFATDGRLLARTTLPSVAWAFYLPDPNGTVFYVGTNGEVLRFDAASLP